MFSATLMIDSVSSLCPIDLIPFAASKPFCPHLPLPNIEDYESDYFSFFVSFATSERYPPPSLSAAGVFVNFSSAQHKNKEALVTHIDTYRTGQSREQIIACE